MKISVPTPPERRLTKICIDPGHGGANPGAVAYDGRMEKDGVLDIALRVRNLLERDGYEVILTRSGDNTVSLSERCRIANDARADLFVSIHMNSCAATKHFPKGVEVYGWGKKSPLAEAVYAGMIETMIPPPVRRGVKDGSKYATVRNTRMPSIVVECGFINNKDEVELLWDNSYRAKIAFGIVKGIEAFCRGSRPATYVHTYESGRT